MDGKVDAERMRKLEAKQIADDEGGGGETTMLPSQFWARLADPRSEPTKRLMVAVLEEAIAVVVNRSSRGSDDHRAVVAEAERWFRSDDRSAPFAFATICDVLGMDPDRVRQAVAAWQGRRRLFARPRLQAGRGRHHVRSGDRSRCRAA
jgi:hypothetical protein